METYLDSSRFKSLVDAQAHVVQVLGLDVLIADLAKFGITLEQYLGAPCKPARCIRSPWLLVVR
jgi:hypothetical protein